MVLFRKMNCASCTEKRILKDHEVSKRGKEESRGKDAGMLRTRGKKNRDTVEKRCRTAFQGRGKTAGKREERIKDHGFV